MKGFSRANLMYMRAFAEAWPDSEIIQMLLRYVFLYNHQFAQSALKSRTPFRAMKDGYAKRPDLFVMRPYDHPGCGNCMRLFFEYHFLPSIGCDHKLQIAVLVGLAIRLRNSLQRRMSEDAFSRSGI